MVKEINDLDEFNKFIKDTKIVIVDFFAVWCGPCKMISPHFNKVAAKYADRSDVAFVKVDVDKMEGNDIEAMPTFRVYKDGKLVNQVQGAPSPDKLEKWIDSYIQ